jgi:hypothetical protein
VWRREAKDRRAVVFQKTGSEEIGSEIGTWEILPVVPAQRSISELPPTLGVTQLPRSLLQQRKAMPASKPCAVQRLRLNDYV